jgi:hypothetical protein
MYYALAPFRSSETLDFAYIKLRSYKNYVYVYAYEV